MLAWDVAPNATSAVITTSLGAVPISVEARPSRSLARRKASPVWTTQVLSPGDLRHRERARGIVHQ